MIDLQWKKLCKTILKHVVIKIFLKKNRKSYRALKAEEVDKIILIVLRMRTHNRNPKLIFLPDQQSIR